VAWDDLPERFGKPSSVHRRFRRWSQQGIWDALFLDGIPTDALGTVMLDATACTAQRFARGARGGGEEDLGRSRPDHQDPRLGRWPPVGLPADARAGGRHALAWLEGLTFERRIGDRAYDTDELRRGCAEHGAEAVIPSQRNRKVPIPHDRTRYRTSHRIENLFGLIKYFTRIVLRKHKT
jgi:transposase